MKYKKVNGLAALSIERRKEISRLGGLAVHQQKKGHEFTPEEASKAGSIGGVARQKLGGVYKFTEEDRRKSALARQRQKKL